MFQKGQFLGLFCKVIGNIRNYLRLFNNYAALAYVLLMELAFEDFYCYISVALCSINRCFSISDYSMTHTLPLRRIQCSCLFNSFSERSTQQRGVRMLAGIFGAGA